MNSLEKAKFTANFNNQGKVSTKSRTQPSNYFLIYNNSSVTMKMKEKHQEMTFKNTKNAQIFKQSNFHIAASRENLSNFQ